MTTLEKLRYLGLSQSGHKYWLKLRRTVLAARCQPPALPAADCGIKLQLRLLGHDFDLDDPQRWYRSPDTGQTWPLLYAPTIPLDAAGDMKLTWELNRHQFLPALAATDPALARRLLRDWVAQNPCGFGMNWVSAMEVGLRLIAWQETFATAPELRDEFAASLEQHARFVRREISTDWIPRGNHLIGEAAALAIYGGEHAAFARRWLAQAAQEQFYPSGIHREQSVAYHHFVTHLYNRAGMAQDRAQIYLSAIQQPDGTLPNIGDNDDGRASTQPLVIPTAPIGSVAFIDAGQYVLRAAGGDYCFVRCGKFGLPPNSAHGHADLLSPVLWLHGTPVLVDPGTFTYNGDPASRRYFRSAHAHNVVTIDERDYANQSGTFAWQNPPRGTCEEWNERKFGGAHDAYRDLGVTVRRQIACDSGGFTIADRIEGTGTHRLRWRFHLHPDQRITRSADGVFQLGDRFALHVTAPMEARLAVGTGSYSPAYGIRVPIQVCEIFLVAALPAAAEFRLQ